MNGFDAFLGLLGVVTGANSYRRYSCVLDANREQLNAYFGLNWEAAPGYTSIRYILLKLDPANVDAIFREHASGDSMEVAGKWKLAIDGKVLKGSFDAFKDKRARQVLSVFNTGTGLIIAHIKIDDKSNEIPAAQRIIATLNLSNASLHLMPCIAKRKPLKLLPSRVRR